MIRTTAAHIAHTTGGRLVGGADPATEVSGPVTIDSRSVAPGGLFAAFEGARVDGHRFAAGALEAGAALCLVTRDVGVPAVLVPDMEKALADLAHDVLERARRTEGDLTVIAITGSAGKTSTKDALGQLLAPHGATIAPPGSHNNEIGLPLTVLDVTEDTRFLVLEMGARGIGHIAYLTSIARPDISVVLNVGTAHLGEFGSPEAIAQAKGELVEALNPDGVAVLNADDPRVAAMAARTGAPVLGYGLERDDTEVAAHDLDLDAEARPVFDLRVGTVHRRVHPRLVGEHQVWTVLAAAAAARAAGVGAEQILAGIDDLSPVSGLRMAVSTRPDGTTVINDAYNANPESMRSALRSLAVIGRGRPTVAVLGPMRELGERSVVMHDEIGRLVVKLNITHTIVVGTDAEAHALFQGAVQEGSWGSEAVLVPDVEAAEAELDRHLTGGEAILVKASHSVGLEAIGEALAGASR